MKKLTSAFCSIVLMFILVGCERRHTENLLMDVESYIMERPDSALSVLDTMNRALLVTDRLKAHHALLHAMALDKNFIDVTDDSIASVAVNYYSRKGPEKYKARALYYLGISYYYTGEYEKAILEFTKAEKIAEKCDSLYLGLIYLIQSDTYSMTHNEIEALKYIKNAYGVFLDISLDYYVSVSNLSLAKLYYNNGDIAKADSMLNRLIISEKEDKRIKATSIQCRAFLMASKDEPDYSNAINLYDILLGEYGSSYMSYKDYWAYAYALIYCGRERESQGIVSQLLQVDTSTTAYYWQYLIEKYKKNYSSALSLLEKSVSSNNIEVTEALKQSLALSQRDYYESQFQIAEYKAHNRKMTILFGVISSFFVLGLIYWVVSAYARRLREEKEYYLNYADEISRQLEASKHEDYPELKRKYIELYKSKFEIIGSLYEQYTLFDGKNNSEHAIYEKVSAMVEDFRNDYSNKEQFESILNENMDNIVSRFRTEVPKLKEMDYSIFCFMLIGFDPTTISHLLNTTMNVIYIRKSRMKKRIETSNPEHKVQFLEVLN